MVSSKLDMVSSQFDMKIQTNIFLSSSEKEQKLDTEHIYFINWAIELRMNL